MHRELDEQGHAAKRGTNLERLTWKTVQWHPFILNHLKQYLHQHCPCNAPWFKMIKIRFAIFPVQVIISYLLYFLLKYLIKYVLEYYTKHNALLAVVLMLIRFARLIHYLYISAPMQLDFSTLLFSSALFSSQIWGDTSLGETDFFKMWRDHIPFKPLLLFPWFLLLWTFVIKS